MNWSTLRQLGGVDGSPVAATMRIKRYRLSEWSTIIGTCPCNNTRKVRASRQKVSTLKRNNSIAFECSYVSAYEYILSRNSFTLGSDI